MDQSVENRIRERAYEMWTAHGCVHGQAEQHWLAAEREVLATSTAVLAGKPNPKKKPRSSAGSKTPKNARDGWLTPGISPEMPAPVRRRSSRKAATTLADSPGDQLPEESDHWHRRLLRVSAAGN
jgi:Protein of unknown function (DUF2934)